MIATDGSDAALEAATVSLRLLHPDATITLVTIAEARHDPMEDAGGFEGPVMTDEEADAEHEASMAHARTALLATAEAVGIPIADAKLVSSVSTVDRALRDLVRDEQPDVLVLGSADEGWFHRFLHGSVEDKLLHHVSCPILIVGHHREH